MLYNTCKNKNSCPLRGVCSDLVRESLHFLKREKIHSCVSAFREMHRNWRKLTFTFSDKEFFENGEVVRSLQFDNIAQFSFSPNDR